MGHILYGTEGARKVAQGRITMARRPVRHTASYSWYWEGDVLWVREPWAMVTDLGRVDPALVGAVGEYVYRADWPRGLPEPKWRSAIFMPKAAACRFFRVTAARRERLQEITELDARREGYASIREFREAWDGYYARPWKEKKRGEIAAYNSWPWEDRQEVRTRRGKPWNVYGNPWVNVYELENITKAEFLAAADRPAAAAASQEVLRSAT